MNRYLIRNKANGLEFEITANELFPKREPEWGRPPRKKKVIDCTPEEILAATRFFQYEENGELVDYAEFADEMHVYKVDNIDPELADIAAKRKAKKDRLKKLKDTNVSNLNTLQEVKDLLKDVLEALTDETT
jgi:hypothetical protein